MNKGGISQSHLEFRGKQLGGKVPFWVQQYVKFYLPLFLCQELYELKCDTLNTLKGNNWIPVFSSFNYQLNEGIHGL